MPSLNCVFLKVLKRVLFLPRVQPYFWLICRCITSDGDPGKGDFEMKIHFKWLNKMDKRERFWIRDLCESRRGQHDQILLSVYFNSLFSFLFSRQSNSIPTLKIHSWFINQSDRRGDACTSCQITANFLTQAIRRLYEISPHTTSLCTTSNFLI